MSFKEKILDILRLWYDKGAVFFFPRKDTLRMEISKKEWVSENSVFFFPLPTFSGKKIRVVNPPIIIFMIKKWSYELHFRNTNSHHVIGFFFYENDYRGFTMRIFFQKRFWAGRTKYRYLHSLTPFLRFWS